MVGKIALTLALVLVLTCVLAASNPVPLIYQPLNPLTVTPGHAAFVLTVHGTGFVSGAVVKGNGVAFLTKFVDAATLQAEVPPRYVAKAGTGSITVANPGSIDSNVVYFTIRKPSQSVVLATDAQTIEGGLMAVADFNNDHVPDLTVTGSNVDVYLNIDYPRLANFEKVAGPAFTQNILFGPIMVADFNNDGNLDVAPCGGDGGPDPTVCDIYFGDGKGDLTLGTSAQVVYAGVMADINGDGILDNIATWGDGYESYLSISLGNGDGLIPTSPLCLRRYPVFPSSETSTATASSTWLLPLKGVRNRARERSPYFLETATEPCRTRWTTRFRGEATTLWLPTSTETASSTSLPVGSRCYWETGMGPSALAPPSICKTTGMRKSKSLT